MSGIKQHHQMYRKLLASQILNQPTWRTLVLMEHFYVINWDEVQELFH